MVRRERETRPSAEVFIQFLGSNVNEFRRSKFSKALPSAIVMPGIKDPPRRSSPTFQHWKFFSPCLTSLA
jgi:hypothetical protein